uniref:Putative secreted protein n=1 Tax=Ixodes ricinus TaxID=34613 RepID=A0A6B0U2R3_IXORI
MRAVVTPPWMLWFTALSSLCDQKRTWYDKTGDPRGLFQRILALRLHTSDTSTSVGFDGGCRTLRRIDFRSSPYSL